MMKKYSIFLCFISIIFGQISIDDMNKLSKSELDAIRSKLLSGEGLSSDSTEDQLMSSKNTTISDVQISSEEAPVSPDMYFGYDYFKRDINFFDNTPTPSDYKLGPGDELIISLWGETNSRENFIINKDGMIYYKNVGFINLSNKNLKEAESLLIEELSRIYSTLKDQESSTKLMLELGKLKSINVYFSGQIEKPGINLIHPFSDVFSALVQAGGVKRQGSLRNIQLIRNNNVISTVDFYSFFSNGKNNFSSTKILDGDVIHVPPISNRVKITGEIYNAGFFEMIGEESLQDLIFYASGTTAIAGSKALLEQILPVSKRTNDDSAKQSIIIKREEFSKTKLNNGDSVLITSIGESNTKVEIFGRVKFPGEYPASTSLKNVLDTAGGFNDSLYRKTILENEIIILRKDEKQFYSLEFITSYKESNNFNLVPGDKIFVYEDPFYENLLSVSVEGEVNKRGSFQLKKGMTVADAIKLAEGFTELANPEAITVTEVFTSLDDVGNEIEEKTQVNDANLDFELTDGSVVNILPLENVVSVVGNVYNPGLITFSKAKTVNKYINLAGGPKPNTLSTKIYVKRANGRIKKVTFFQGLGTLVKPGDTIVVPVDPDPTSFDITAFIADFATTLANIAAILVIVDNQSDN
tara:strand:- start:1828 stop:3747 length:1920 start_codon:yes stop_codon:yes gene_type:complete